jgi:hypothetical protein
MDFLKYPPICCLQETVRVKGHGLKMKRWKRLLHTKMDDYTDIRQKWIVIDSILIDKVK